MPNKHAAIKDLRKNERRAAANGRIKTHVKSLFSKGVETTKTGKKAEAVTAAQKFQQTVDKAVKRNILSRNAASRKKSQLAKMVKGMKA